MNRQALGNIIGVLLIVFAIYRMMGGEGVLPIPVPPKVKPIEASGFRVLVVYESNDLSKYPASQLSVINSTEIRSYLMSKCAREGNQPDYRFLDEDADLSQDYAHWQKAMTRPRTTLPWIVIGGDNDGYEGPLPDSIPAALELLRKYGGA